MKSILKIYIITLIFIFGNLIAQSDPDLENILKAYPDWKTNFSKRSIEFSELQSGGPPKDGIPALTDPKFISVEDASEWLKDKEPVIFLKHDNFVKGYPLQILIWHEIVNDRIGSVPVSITFCPLCYSAIVFKRTIGTMTVMFGVTGLLRNSDLVMYDSYTESFWQQFTGEAIVGSYTGTQLEPMPAQIISFKEIKDSYPEAEMLSRETGYIRRYGMNPYMGYDDIDQTPFMFNGGIDDRLPPNEKVIGIKESGFVKAYPYSITKDKRVINDELNDKYFVIFHSKGTVSALDSKFILDSRDVGSTGVFYAVLDGKKLTFEYSGGKFMDIETSSIWDITGKAVMGTLRGKQLRKINSGDYFAFAWFAFNPDSKVYKE